MVILKSKVHKMNDRKLLELAAKAAGLCEYSNEFGRGPMYRARYNGLQDYSPWNPLTSDSDALRLAVILGLWIHIGKYDVAIDGTHIEESSITDMFAATRRAIVRAAAEIGLKND